MLRFLPLHSAALHCTAPDGTALRCTARLCISCELLLLLLPCCRGPFPIPYLSRLSVQFPPELFPPRIFVTRFNASPLGCGGPLQVVCTAQQGQGLEILGGFVLRDGALFLDVDVGSHWMCFFLPRNDALCCLLSRGVSTTIAGGIFIYICKCITCTIRTW